MERRILLAFVLAFLVLYGFQALFVPPPPQPAVSPAPADPAVTAPGAPVEAVVPPVPVPTPDPEPAPVTAEAEERLIRVESPRFSAVLSNRGARLVSWRLKNYQDDLGEPIDLVPSALPADQPTPFSLQVDDPQVTARLNSALYQVSGDVGGRLDVNARGGTLTFEFQDAAGVHARKDFRFEPDGYEVVFSSSVRRGDETLNPTILWGPGLSDLGAASAGGSVLFAGYVQAPQAIYHREGDVTRIPATNLAAQTVHEGQFRFAGVDDHYFMATAVNPGPARLEYRAVTLPGAAGTERHFVAHSIRLAQPPQDVRFYVGPKKFEILQAVDGELVRAIHFGIFGFLAVPLLNSLNWIHGYVGNYGWSIVILTILINLSLFYFRHKSVVSMRKMQLLQPQMKAIQERYKGLKVTDPARQKMNTEIMNLYREKGVNPASGCLPMIMMMPVLIAFYSFLSVAIELRGAEFGWWIQDLSRPDPYFVVPILMGVTMFWQQRITPTTVDPMQQRIMMMMPVMFTFMFLWFPSGLVIYWFTSNLWAIGQQYFTYWLIGPPVPVAPRPPAERRVKNAGAGRSVGAEKRT